MLVCTRRSLGKIPSVPEKTPRAYIDKFIDIIRGHCRLIEGGSDAVKETLFRSKHFPLVEGGDALFQRGIATRGTKNLGRTAECFSPLTPSQLPWNSFRVKPLPSGSLGASS
jgi:hypothetical protein